MPTFTHHDLELLNPSFDSDLVDVLSELEHSFAHVTFTTALLATLG